MRASRLAGARPMALVVLAAGLFVLADAFLVAAYAVVTPESAGTVSGRGTPGSGCSSPQGSPHSLRCAQRAGSRFCAACGRAEPAARSSRWPAGSSDHRSSWCRGRTRARALITCRHSPAVSTARPPACQDLSRPARIFVTCNQLAHNPVGPSSRTVVDAECHLTSDIRFGRLSGCSAIKTLTARCGYSARGRWISRITSLPWRDSHGGVDSADERVLWVLCPMAVYESRKHLLQAGADVCRTPAGRQPDRQPAAHVSPSARVGAARNVVKP